MKGMSATLPISTTEEKRWKWAATGLYSASFVALGLTFSILGPTLPSLQTQTASTLNEISILFVARSIGSLVGSVGGGRLFDRYSGHKVIAAALALMILATALIPNLPQLWMLTAILFLSGIVHGTLNVGNNAMLIWVHRDGVAPYMNVLHFFFGLGTFFTPILVAQVLLLTGGISLSYWLVALTFVPVTLLALFLRSPQPQQKAGFSGSFKTDPWLVAGFFAIFMGYAGASAAHGGLIFTYVTRMKLGDETSAALVNSLFWGALTAGRLLSIPFAVKFAPKTMLRMDLWGALASLALMVIFPHSIWTMGIGSAGLGFFLATIFPTNMSLASRHIPITGKITGILSIGSSLGALILPWLVGQTFDAVAPETLLSLDLANILLTLLVFYGLIYRLNQAALKNQSNPAPDA
jgi:MFS transporter, FHS family, Na+ dependent glucose transporter 1